MNNEQFKFKAFVLVWVFKKVSQPFTILFVFRFHQSCCASCFVTVCHLKSGISWNPETKSGKIPESVLEQRSVTCDPLDCKERKRCVHGLDPPAVLVNEAFSREGGRAALGGKGRRLVSTCLFSPPCTQWARLVPGTDGRRRRLGRG